MKKWLWVGISLTILVGGLELFARVLEEGTSRNIPNPNASGGTFLDGAAKLPNVDQSIHIPQSQAGGGWGFAPNSVVEQGRIRSTINDLGLRGPNVPSKKDGEIRVLSLGDSCVYGYGVENAQTFLSIAVWELASHTKKTIRPINGAIPGHSTEQSLRVLKGVGRIVQPDIVVIANIWSDLYDGMQRKEPQRSSWALLRWGEKWIGDISRKQDVSWVYTGADITQAPENEGRIALREYRENLKALYEESLALGAKPVFLLLPAPIDMGEGVPEWIDEYRVVMELVAEEVHAPIVHAESWWKEHEPLRSDFYDNVHPSVSGHEKIGEALAETLKTMNAFQ